MENKKPALLNELIRERRAVFPQHYLQKEISRDVLEQLMENAHWAPTHKRTEPWRFVVLQGNALQRLSDFLADSMIKAAGDNPVPEIRIQKAKEKPLQSACVIAIVLHRSAEEVLPEWEEVAALSCAVQNLWLSATAYGIGGYWSTPGAIREMGPFLGLAPNERCLGLFYMGYRSEEAPIEGRRSDFREKVRWISE